MNMPIYKTANFSKEELDAVQYGVDLVKRYLYNDDEATYGRYKSFSVGAKDSLNEAEGILRDTILALSYEKSGVSKDKNRPEEAIRYPGFKRAFLSIIEEIANTLTTTNEVESVMNFCEVRNLALGDSAMISIGNPNAYQFSKTGRGIEHSPAQRRYKKEVVLAPETIQATISYNMSKILAGRLLIGQETAKLVRGLRSAYLYDVADLVYSTTTTGVINKFIQDGAFSEANFRAMANDVQAWNGSTGVVVFGTNISLANLLPSGSTNVLRNQLGGEFMDRGYISTAFGVPAIELPQAIRPDSTFTTDASTVNTILSDSYAVIASVSAPKPVVLGLGGGVMMKEDMTNQTSDMIVTACQDVDVKLASESVFGLIKTTS